MKWITRQQVGVDRCACAWLIRTRIDPQAEFLFVPSGTDPSGLDGHTFDMRGAEFGHEGVKCSFETLLERHALTTDRALVEMGRIIRDADVPAGRAKRPEAAGLSALIYGFRQAWSRDDERLIATAPLYDALYRYCQAKVVGTSASHGTPRPKLRLSARVDAHLATDEA